MYNNHRHGCEKWNYFAKDCLVILNYALKPREILLYLPNLSYIWSTVGDNNNHRHDQWEMTVPNSSLSGAVTAAETVAHSCAIVDRR